MTLSDDLSGRAPWPTVHTTRDVLAVVHNVTAATRLLDVAELVGGDLRVQTTFTVPPYSAFVNGTERFLAEHGIRPLPWHAATARRFDLAIGASHGGDLRKLDASHLIIPHGMGYNKYLSPEPGARSPEPGARSPEPGARNPEPGTRCSGCPRSGCSTAVN